MKRMVLSILVDNTAGVLSRVAGLFARRGYNIDSLTVSETKQGGSSRMTIVVSGEDEVLEQIQKQLAKLVEVKDIIELKDGASVCRELILCKVAVDPSQRQQILSVADIFRAKIVDVSADSLMIELTGNQQKLDAFIGLLEGFEVLELVRTGITGLTRGKLDMLAGELE
ncbi:MAG: acetolactate synthase small subunit [Lachnospiraceae bacterium]|nr:acetolactate synthase small subunit [Lachnospiraceae bacterium]